MSFAHRVLHLEAEGAYQVLSRAQELESTGRDIIHLEIGEPDFRTASHISFEGMKAIADGKTRYNPPSGIVELREAIAEDAGRRRGIAIDPAQVVVSPGAKPILFFPALALCKELGLFGGALVGIDGSFFRANASKRSIYTHKRIQTALEKLEKQIEEYLTEMDQLDLQEGQAEGDQPALPEQLEALKARQEKQQRRKKKLEQSGVNKPPSISSYIPNSRN